MRSMKKAIVVAGVMVLAAGVPATLALARASAGVANCTRDQLGLRSNGTQGAAGTVYGAWVLTNLSSSKCVVNGYPGVNLYGAKGRPIPLTVKHSLLPGPAQVTLSAGSSATFRTSYSDVPSSAQGCPLSSVIQVTAPGANASLFIPAELGLCRGILNISAMEPGVHSA
jgi:Protein of unknown function (DUF4232)